MLAIGIGCFWLSAKGKGKNPSAAHLKDVKSALESIDNISDLEIDIDPGIASFSDVLYGDDGPLFCNGAIEFDLYLPFRVQEQYSRRLGGIEVEKFHVSITFSYYFPVTFIYYLVPDDQDVETLSPSNSVMIAREFLTEKLKDHSKVQFNCLGPSPLHIDLFVKNLEGDETESTTELPSRGYNSIIIMLDEEDDDFLMSWSTDTKIYYRVITA